jgi:hypothetical protein
MLRKRNTRKAATAAKSKMSIIAIVSIQIGAFAACLCRRKNNK